MDANQSPWPRRWLMTDERIGDRLWEAIDRLPEGGGGIVYRHHRLGASQRSELGRQVAGLARAKGLMLAVSRDVDLAERLEAMLVHNPVLPTALPCSRSIHDEAEALAARQGSALVFISPLYPTRSHPDAPTLSVPEAARLADIATSPAIALGGMNEARWSALDAARPGTFHGYAGIDCWLEP